MDPTRFTLRPSRGRNCAAKAEHFDALLGLEYVEVSAEHMSGVVPITDQVRQPYGLVHGGVLASIAESLASVGTAIGVHEAGSHAMGMSNFTTFMRPMLQGSIHAEAHPRHKGRTTWIWDVEFSDDAGTICAVSRVTIAVRAARP